MARSPNPIPGKRRGWNGKRVHHRPCIISRRRRSSAKDLIITRGLIMRRWSMPEVRPALAEQFDSLEQQHEAATLGIWRFLATEVLFFGGLFTAYVVYRFLYPQAFAEASHHTNLLYGTVNTAVLLTSSLTMALAGHSAQGRPSRKGFRCPALTILLWLGVLLLQ